MVHLLWISFSWTSAGGGIVKVNISVRFFCETESVSLGVDNQTVIISIHMFGTGYKARISFQRKVIYVFST